jgi:hypothetical protein
MPHYMDMKWHKSATTWRLHREVVSHGVAPRDFSAKSPINKSTKKLSQVLDTCKTICTYASIPNKE